MSAMELIPARLTTTLTVFLNPLANPWYDTSMATARSANSNYIKPLTERTTNKKAHQLVGRHLPPSQTDFVLTSCDGWQSKQHFPN
ncbi:uncharacterized protein EAF02_002875 [Botrytis sinoallii]|uniref:uncharacterized protein n=1 Tax=Botrytis sinoallii TaxID=1463999 RepID=UPI00190269AF|nr:uncharacterized protein EAF02_002875 [Botrytis sinoallii]KAF7888334.1 hypothetical protein EAF02_002875 [Botrytis sinoallii]